MRILAIETSCDETSAAVLEKNGNNISVLSNITATSLSLHATTGGIIPENAARMQVEYIMPVVTEALIKTKGDINPKTKSKKFELAREILEHDIDSIAVTYGPGLIGSLLVGVETAKTLSYTANKPLIPVNHLLAHIYANFISPSSNSQISVPSFPFVGLIVSGGHTDLLYFEAHNKYTWLGGTRDDAAGEAFDKIGRLLGLSYPAGPEIERRANFVSNPSVKFKSPIMHEDNFDFSFSGLKTEALRFAQNNNLTEDTISQACYATQKAIIDVLVKKTLKAAEKYEVLNILVGGGVSANQTFRNQLVSSAKNQNPELNIHFPEKEYSTDNAAMVGAYALMNVKIKEWSDINANPELYFA